MSAPTFVQFVESLGVTLTPGQRALALVAVDGIAPSRLDPEDRTMAERLLGHVQDVPPSARLVLAIVKGARIGGSYVFGGLYSLWRAFTANLSTLAPGEQAVALIVAPDLRLARQVLRYALGAAESAPSLARLIESKATESFTIRRPDGHVVAIECLPATRGGSAVRGRSLVSAVLSETAFFRDSSAVVNDLDLFRAVMPRVMPGGLTIMESTPWVEAGLLFDEFSRNFGDPKSALAAHCPTLVMRPDERTAAIVANERARDPDNAQREFDAQFITGGSGLFFGPDLLAPALVRDLPLTKFNPGGRVAIGGDFGLVTDASTFCAVGSNNGVITVLDGMEMRPKKNAPLKLSNVVAEGCTFATRYGQQMIHVDHHELIAAREHLSGGVILKPCRGGQDAKTDRFLRVREAFRTGQVRIPGSLVRLSNQLSMIVAKPQPGGGTSIVLPRRAGTHMDLASAFVLAVDAVTKRQNGLFAAFCKLQPTDDGWANPLYPPGALK